MDYCISKAVSICDPFLIAGMHDCIYSLDDASIFSTLPGNRGSCQVEVADEDRNKAAFASYHRLFQFTWMKFDLLNAPKTFQHGMDMM